MWLYKYLSIINKAFVLQVWQQLLSLYFGWRSSLNGILSLFAVLVPFLEWYLAWMFLTIYLIHLPKNWVLFASGSVLPLLCFFSTGESQKKWISQFFQKTNEVQEKIIPRSLRIVFSSFWFIFWKNWEFPKLISRFTDLLPIK